jgi:hypothetical protein
LKGSFIVDLIAVIPFDFLFLLFLREENMMQKHKANIKIIGLLKLIRLLRLRRIIILLNFIGDFKFGLKLIIIVLCFLVVLHWNTCIWYIVIEYSKIRSNIELVKSG